MMKLTRVLGMLEKVKIRGHVEDSMEWDGEGGKLFLVKN